MNNRLSVKIPFVQLHIITIIIIIINFCFVSIIQHFKILQIVFRSKKLNKANYKPSKMKVLKDTFRQSFKLHIYWWELKKKCVKTHTYLHVHINRHYAYAYMHKQAHTHVHIDYRPNYIIIYT